MKRPFSTYMRVASDRQKLKILANDIKKAGTISKNIKGDVGTKRSGGDYNL